MPFYSEIISTIIRNKLRLSGCNFVTFISQQLYCLATTALKNDLMYVCHVNTRTAQMKVADRKDFTLINDVQK